MTRGLARRLERLERRSGGHARLIVIAGPEEVDTATALAALAVEAAEEDLVVHLRRIETDSPPDLISIRSKHRA